MKVSIRCRARRTGERVALQPIACAGRVSIRCRARRTGERHAPCVCARKKCFYSLWCETYRRTGVGGNGLPLVEGFYSLSCETYRRTGGAGGADVFGCFYSLSCETYRRTGYVVGSRRSGHSFLFAVVRDVQANLADVKAKYGEKVVSIRCRARRTGERPRRRPPGRRCPRRFYSLSCETYRRTWPSYDSRDYLEVSIRCRARRTGEPVRTIHTYRRHGRFLFAVVRDVQANRRPQQRTGTSRQVSIRCRARRTGELLWWPSASTPRRFLFAVVRDVQANCDHGSAVSS